MDIFTRECDFQNVRLVATAFALGAADEDVAQELHLHFFKPAAAASFATPGAAVKRKCAGGESFTKRVLRAGKQFAHAVENSEVKRGRALRCACEWRLIHEDDLPDLLCAGQLFYTARCVLARDAMSVQQVFIKHAMDERGFARTAHASDAREDSKRQTHCEITKVVFARALDAQPCLGCTAHCRNGDALFASQIRSRERRGNCRLNIADCRLGIAPCLAAFTCSARTSRACANFQSAICNLQFAMIQHRRHLAAKYKRSSLFPPPRSQLDDVIRRSHHGFVVLDDK